MAVEIHINDVMKAYDKNIVIHNLSLDIKPGEFFTLLGPSGCGKTTLLRMIAGFNTIEDGTIAFDDKVINNIPVFKRNFGMVFQSYAIFPHMTVRGNIEYGLKNKKLPKDEIRRRVDEIMEIVQITKYADRYPNKLSGGQQQRVALARAIVVEPQVLLMDEPLSNLDAKLRIEMREAIRDIQKKIGITTVYVTHDQEEALAISDRIAVINSGDIQQVGGPEYIYSRPYNTFVANFMGHSNRFEGEVLSYKDETATIRLETGFEVLVGNMKPVNKGQTVFVYIRPEEFDIEEDSEGTMDSKVLIKRFLGKYTQYIVKCGGKEFEVTADTNGSNHVYEAGEMMKLGVNCSRINVFDNEGEITLIKGVKNI